MSKIHTVFGAKHNAVDRVSAVGLVPARHHQGPFAEKIPDCILFLNQIHSAAVVDLHDLDHVPELDVDASVTSLSNVALAVKTADCAPVMLWDEQSHIIAAVHSGWQGTLKNIIAPTVAAMLLKGADTSRIKVQIGPCLQQANLAMGSDVRDQFVAASPENARFFATHPAEQGKYLFDNVGMITSQLQEAGIKTIEADKTCTLDQAKAYYSYRYRDQDATHENMRNVSLIWRED